MKAMRRFGRRWFIGSAALAGSAAVLAACAPVAPSAPAESGSGQAEATTSVAPSAEAQIEGNIIVWNFPQTEDDDKFIYSPLNAKFAQEQPGIKVEVETLPWDGRREKLMTAFSAGAPPDVWLSSSDTLPRWIKSGVVLGLDECLGPEVLADYNPDVLSIGQWEGKVYMVPVYTGCYGRLYNKTMLEEIGRDPDQPIVKWDEIREFAPKAKEKGYYFSQWNLTSWDQNLALVWQAGGTVFSEDRTKVQLTSEPSVQAFTFLVEMFQNGWFPEEGAVGSQEEASRVTTDYFLTGQQVQSWSQSAIYITTVQQQAPDVVWGMNPAWENVRATTPFFSGNWSITSISKQVPAACEWIRFMVRADNLGFWCSVANQVPGSVAALDYWTVDRDKRAFVELQTPALFANQDSSAYYQEAKLICAPHLQAACLGQKTVEQALADAQTELQAIVDEQLAK